MDFRHENYTNMFEVITRSRKERFERNKKAAGLHKGIPIYNIDDKVYLSFRRATSGHWAEPPSCHHLMVDHTR